MTAYETRLVRRETVAEETMAFYFERPAGFAYEAGQHATVAMGMQVLLDRLGIAERDVRGEEFYGY
jgi:ferredoxin-NADP reductase